MVHGDQYFCVVADEGSRGGLFQKLSQAMQLLAGRGEHVQDDLDKGEAIGMDGGVCVTPLVSYT